MSLVLASYMIKDETIESEIRIGLYSITDDELDNFIERRLAQKQVEWENRLRNQNHYQIEDDDISYDFHF